MTFNRIPRLSATASVVALGLSLLAAAPAASAFTVTARDSAIEVTSNGLTNASGCPSEPNYYLLETSQALSSRADLNAGEAGLCYSDMFGRLFVGDYHAVQDVTFLPALVAARLSQTAHAQVDVEGFPASRAVGLAVNNSYKATFTLTEPTTLNLLLKYTGQAAFNVKDRVAFNVIGRLPSGLVGYNWDLALQAVPPDTWHQETLLLDPQYTYEVTAYTLANVADAETISSALTFSLREPRR